MNFQVGDIVFWNNGYWKAHGETHDFPRRTLYTVWHNGKWFAERLVINENQARKVEKLEALVVLGIKI